MTIDRTARYREVFAEPVFRTLFGSRTLSIGADTLRMLALSVLVYQGTGSALLTAVAFGIGFVPQVIGGTLLGSFADRLPARGLIVAGTMLDGALAALLALVPMPVGVALALVGLFAVITPVFQGVVNRLIAESLTGDAYVLGRSLSSVSGASAQLLGLAAGGLALATLGPTRTLLIAAAGPLVAAGWARLGLPRVPAAQPAAETVRRSWNGTVRLWRDRNVRPLLLMQWVPPACVTGVESIVVPYAAGRGLPDGTAGPLLASVAAGMLLGNLAVGRLLRPTTRERLVGPILVIGGLPVVALIWPVPLWAAIIALGVAGAGLSYGLGLQRAFLDALDPDLRGQAFALQFTGLMTLQGAGPLVAGALADLTRVPVAMAIMGLGTTVAGLVWWHAHDARPTDRIG